MYCWHLEYPSAKKLDLEMEYLLVIGSGSGVKSKFWECR